MKAFILVHNTVFDQLTETVLVRVNGELRGGWVWAGKLGQWNAVLVTTTENRLDVIDASPNAILLVRMSDGRQELENDIDPVILTRLNTWLTARGITIEENAPIRQIIRKLFRRFETHFEIHAIEVN